MSQGLDLTADEYAILGQVIERDLARAEREKKEARRAELQAVAEKVRKREKIKAEVIKLFEEDSDPEADPDSAQEEEDDYDVNEEIFGVKTEELDRDLFDVGYPHEDDVE